MGGEPLTQPRRSWKVYWSRSWLGSCVMSLLGEGTHGQVDVPGEPEPAGALVLQHKYKGAFSRHF